MEENELISFVKNAPEEIKKSFKKIKVPFGEKLLIQGNPCEYVYILERGSVKTYHMDFAGELYLEDIDTKPTIFGELEAFTNDDIITTVETISACELVQIEKEIFVKWIE